MAEAVSLQVVLKLVGTMTQDSDLSSASDVIAKDYTKVFANGTGAGQANMWWHDQRTLIASATETLDLSGSLTSVFGTSIVMTSLKGLLVYAAAGNTNDVQITRSPTTTGVPWLMAAGDGIALKPGALVLWLDPSANGAAVAPAADLITFTNSAGSTGVTYDVFLLGEV